MVEWSPDGRVCPICGGPGRESQSYPAAMCRDCEGRLVDWTGRPVRVGNSSFIGTGTEVWNGEESIVDEDTPIFVDGICCWAREVRWGGIAVQPVAAWLQPICPVDDPDRMKTLSDFGYDGRAVLDFLVRASPWRSTDQAIASLSIFAHPDVVAASGRRAIFRTVRRMADRGKITDGVMSDDNHSPAIAFEWSTGCRRPRGSDVTCCHLYAASGNPDAYTDLRNIFFAPSFISKLTDSQAPRCRLSTPSMSCATGPSYYTVIAGPVAGIDRSSLSTTVNSSGSTLSVPGITRRTSNFDCAHAWPRSPRIALPSRPPNAAGPSPSSDRILPSSTQALVLRGPHRPGLRPAGDATPRRDFGLGSATSHVRRSGRGRLRAASTVAPESRRITHPSIKVRRQQLGEAGVAVVDLPGLEDVGRAAVREAHRSRDLHHHAPLGFPHAVQCPPCAVNEQAFSSVSAVKPLSRKNFAFPRPCLLLRSSRYRVSLACAIVRVTEVRGSTAVTRPERGGGCEGRRVTRAGTGSTNSTS